MKQFKLNSTEKTAENVIKAIERRARRQSLIYYIGFVVVAFLLTGYILNTISVLEYDGYIHHKDIRMRANTNLAIVDYYVKPGDIVNEGDTLYSYLMVDWLENQTNPFFGQESNEKKVDSDLRIAKYRSEIIEVNNNIDSLNSTISSIKREIHSGVKTEDELVNLNLQLAERTERAKHLKRAISAEYTVQSRYKTTIINNSSLTTQGMTERRLNLEKYGSALRYRCAYVDSKIIDIRATVGMTTFEREEILMFQPIGHPEMTNTHVAMIVEADRYEDIVDGMEVDVYASGDFLCSAKVTFLGVRMADAFANVELLLDRSTEINGKVIVALEFLDGYKLPERYLIHHYPVLIKHRVWSGMSSWYQWLD